MRRAAAAGDLPGPGRTSPESSTRTVRALFNRASGVTLRKAKAGRADLDRVGGGVDRQPLRRRSHGRPRQHGEEHHDDAPARCYHRIPVPGIRRPIVTMALRLSVFSGKPTTKNAGPAWKPKPVDTRTSLSVFSSQTE